MSRKFQVSKQGLIFGGKEIIHSIRVNDRFVELQQELVIPSKESGITQFFSYSALVWDEHFMTCQCLYICYDRAEAWKRYKQYIYSLVETF